LGDNLQIRVARKDGKPVAAMLTLRHRATIIYKYGCSDERFHHLGGMPFLFWKLIEESKSGGAETIDYGRSDLDHYGLIAFKDKFGASKRKLLYCRYNNPQVKQVNTKAKSWNSRTTKRIFEFLPDAALSIGGRMLYRHMG
jgi:lipid II:glycine glycyltransferase (peptidoglycan interpeptide bridge formation enzyme)